MIRLTTWLLAAIVLWPASSLAQTKVRLAVGGRFTADGAETALKVLREFDAGIRNAEIDLSATYTSAFLDKAATR